MATVNPVNTEGALGKRLAAGGAALRGVEVMAVTGRTGRRTKLLISGAVVALALVYLAYTAVQSGAVYYLTVAELQAKGAAVQGQRVRVAGKVLAGSTERDGGTLRFTVVDDAALAEASAPSLLARLFPRAGDGAARSTTAAAGAGAQPLRVTYRGVVPDVFSDEVDVVVEGKLSSAGVFEATTLLAKCPSRFESGTAQETGAQSQGPGAPRPAARQ